MTISVSHFPPGTSKWNKIEHRLFCQITESWRGWPLTDHAWSNLSSASRTAHARSIIDMIVPDLPDID